MPQPLQRLLVRLLLSLALLLSATHAATAIEVKVSAQALERTLQAQLFNGPQGRYYIRGDANSACYVYAESPHVTFVRTASSAVFTPNRNLALQFTEPASASPSPPTPTFR